ncbi:Uncharacterized protein dnm_085010 [Desulfonema magnum]|uniref:Uncharacterized protein n=1 Tax=Desulfonema magnum TaxID=45655 RepID=A0A975BVA6_9BACT|nr:Uncharacterized protein dnm_085010 [Desulfonema magnum]
MAKNVEKYHPVLPDECKHTIKTFSRNALFRINFKQVCQ